MLNPENESAVSEVIGVILIVALTVIMAAIIAAYVFGMMEGVPQSRTVVATVDQPDGSHMYVTYRGGPDHAMLSSLTIMWPSGTQQTIVSPKIGDVYAATNIGAVPNVTPGRDHVVVTGHFKNNMAQVILDAFV
jgi:archaeal type IV pilus assembly protein PilA